MLLKKKRELKWCPDQSWVDIKQRKIVRCPTCNRKLLPREIYNISSIELDSNELVGYKIPPHKTRKNV